MREVSARVISASKVSKNPNATGRFVIVPSGFKGAWIVVYEDYDYTLDVRYANSEDFELFGLKDDTEG